ncbi:MAG: DNA replication terminus site-binding protein, partial [gamma proteobacterium symbiont of Lucinoma myriamae]|nr:DNA replication terminus site-binding protein [gamma proteobacterium symbiont of Lucinoma myriamae]
VIVLDKAIQYRFDALNEAKSSLQALMATHYKPGSRARITQRLFKGVSMLQLYRHIFAFDEPINKILFSWAGRTHSCKKLTEIQVVELLERSRFTVPLTHSYDEWQNIIDMEISHLAYSPSNSHYRLHRPIAPHPRVMIYHEREHQHYEKHDAMLHANLPIFTYVPGGSSLPEIKALKPWLKDQHRLIRKDKLKSEVVVEPLHLYRLTE